jgi:hypothetical protein
MSGHSRAVDIHRKHSPELSRAFNPTSTQSLHSRKSLSNWFTATTGHLINQSQISKILGLNYDLLDDVHTRKDIQEIKGKSRSSARDWPELEGALFK